MALRTRGEKQATEGVVEDAEVTGAARRPPVRFERWGERTVRVVWGEEKVTPVPNSYSTLTVGPFEVTFTLEAGEELGPRLEAANRELLEVAEVERERKATAFINKLRQVAQRVREDR